jgi:hypothetical protein
MRIERISAGASPLFTFDRRFVRLAAGEEPEVEAL